MSQSVSGSDSRLYALDALRFLAALAVMIRHFSPDWFTGSEDISAVGKYGFLGVELFFMISGFAILMSAQGVTLREFVTARCLRILPAFWICCTVSTLILGLSWSLYMDNMASLGQGPVRVDSVYWTLGLEVKFYAAVAVLILFDRLVRIELFLWVWLALSAIDPSLPMRERLMLDYAPYFVGGCAIHLLRGGRTWTRFALLACAWLLSMYWAAVHADLREPGQSGVIYDRAALRSIITGCYMVLVAIAFQWIRLPPSRAVLLLGAISYPLYLLHHELSHMFIYGMGSPGLWGYALIGVWMVASAWAVHRFAEVPLRRWLLVRAGKR